MSKAETAVEAVELTEVNPLDQLGQPVFNQIQHDIIKDLSVDASVRLGKASITVEKLFNLKENETIQLDSAATDPLELVVNGSVVAKGEIVIVDGCFGIKVTQLSE
ncbi:FliM/FliN family flagellar motor switch protein [Spartinivicinus ruber]|uniref:FliM/FliN family flagellar motor switch protein n=1 Tax=Spartinivicinus ruber TaxID=2683272 RepID=UPI0013D4C8CF|nr:FliM/FliN family flagellar motor switch protein [Spartinivicinus ruber]